MYDRRARRARPLATRRPSPHVPPEFGEEVILFDSVFAAPQLLPDLAPYAAVALTEHRDETLQYASGRGQPYLRAWLAEWMNAAGCDVTADHILVTNGAKQRIDLVPPPHRSEERRVWNEGVSPCRSRWSPYN